MDIKVLAKRVGIGGRTLTNRIYILVVTRAEGTMGQIYPLYICRLNS